MAAYSPETEAARLTKELFLKAARIRELEKDLYVAHHDLAVSERHRRNLEADVARLTEQLRVTQLAVGEAAKAAGGEEA